MLASCSITLKSARLPDLIKRLTQMCFLLASSERCGKKYLLRGARLTSPSLQTVTCNSHPVSDLHFIRNSNMPEVSHDISITDNICTASLHNREETLHTSTLHTVLSSACLRAKLCQRLCLKSEKCYWYLIHGVVLSRK